VTRSLSPIEGYAQDNLTLQFTTTVYADNTIEEEMRRRLFDCFT